MGSDATRRGRRPASVAITILLLALAYWAMPAPSDSTPDSRPDGSFSTSGLNPANDAAARQPGASEPAVAMPDGPEDASRRETDDPSQH